MDFDLSDDQVALVDGLRSMLGGRFDRPCVRSMIDAGLHRGRWRELGDTGVFSMTVAVADGGVGLGWVEAALTFEELGRSLVPGPLVATTLAATLRPALADGGTVVGLVEASGGALVVEHWPALDQLILVDAEAIWLIDDLEAIPAIVEPRPLDPLTPVARIESLPAGQQIGDASDSLMLRRRGAVLTSALQLGLAVGALELAVDYAKDRQQFGRPIGSFQAIKHLCADMLGRVEVCRAAVYMAAVALDDPGAVDPDRAISVARLLADESAGPNGKDCVQIHGGMGYTWEIDAHLYLKRAWVLESVFGSSDHHAEWLADSVLG